MIICKRPAHMDDHLQKAGSGGNDDNDNDKDNNNNNDKRGDGGRSPGWHGWPGVTGQKEKKEKEKHYIKPFHQPLLASRKELWGYVRKY